jgi:hypothetical protein
MHPISEPAMIPIFNIACEEVCLRHTDQAPFCIQQRANVLQIFHLALNRTRRYSYPTGRSRQRCTVHWLRPRHWRSTTAGMS